VFRSIVAIAVALITIASAASAFTDKDAGDLLVKALHTKNLVLKISIGQLLYEGLLVPAPGTLHDIVWRSGSFRAKTAYTALRAMRTISADYGKETILPPAAVTCRVSAKLEVPAGVDPATLKAYVSGWGLHYGTPHAAPVAADGQVSVPTGRKGAGFLVVRGPGVDIAYGGDLNRIQPRFRGAPWSPLEKSRFVLESGHDLIVDFLFPFTATPDWGLPNLVAPKAARLDKKTPGKAKFVYFAENSRSLSTTLVDPQQPIGRVEVVGDFNNWNTDPQSGTQMEIWDDGGMVAEGSTDAVGGDGVMTRTLDLPKGTHGYAFLVNGAPVLQRDPYEEGSKIVTIPSQLGNFSIRVSTITVE
jgi:hypothetical protein